MDSELVSVRTDRRTVTDVTGIVSAFCAGRGDGLCNVRYQHQHGSLGHGADHLLPVLVSPSLSLPAGDGRLLLGTWQSVVLVDTNPDNPTRQLRCTWLGAAG